MPSRSFAIQRAVLNAAFESYSVYSGVVTIADYLKAHTDCGIHLPDYLHKRVISWYRDYVKEYGHPEADGTGYHPNAMRT